MANIPVLAATYRFQFNSEFRFADGSALVNYLADLGITDVYASPILSSRKGSKHGYDVTDPTQIDPEIGSVQDFEELQSKLLERGMHLVLDIVPNHMAASNENRWWMDILENGPSSGFASYFDVDWHPPSRNLDGKVLLPILAHPFGEVLDRGELKLIFEGGKLYVQYVESMFPLTPRSYRRLLKHRVEELKASLSEESPVYQEYSGIIAALSQAPEGARSDMSTHKRGQIDAVRERLQKLAAENPPISSFIERNIADFNGKAGDVASLCALEHLLGDQHFMLAYWQDPNEGINYRRFFAISELVGVRVEDPLVFEATHDHILRFASRPAVRGVRVDHIDGLLDPAGYLNRLQERLTAARPEESDRPCILVEKILSRDECLPEDWPVSGTTGYEYLNAANSLFVSPSGAKEIENAYFDFIGTKINFADVMYDKKKLVMNTLLRVEMRSLGRQLVNLASHDRYARNLLRQELMDVLIEVTACLPLYRTYIRNLDVTESAKQLIDQAVQDAHKRRPRLSRACFNFLRDVLTLANPPHILADQREERLAFVMRWQQFTGPIVAKGIEDTALYVYYPLLSLNEVGGSPEPSRLMSWDYFCNFILQRQKHWPNTMNAASTHDTKRSEDARARINVLSEIPGEWAKVLGEWAKRNEAHKQAVDRGKVPDANEEYLIYQTLIGLWPTEMSELPAITKRLRDYAIKATREASVHTRWSEPNKPHEQAICNFIDQILSPHINNASFLRDVSGFMEKIAYAGMINSLGQTLLRIACPGVPDFYQGTELWDYHLVDPDNRGSVNFPLRTQALKDIIELDRSDNSGVASLLFANWPNGHIKLYLIWKVLGYRNEHPELFADGEFIPVQCAGPRSLNILSFLRRHGNEQALTVISRWQVNSPADAAGRQNFWKGTVLQLAADCAPAWRNIFTTQRIISTPDARNRSIPIGDILKDLPIALLTAAAEPPGQS
jgi:(1->4)-alpha-D-glucan 1-alpha-D-glucosylmutase